VTLGVLLADPEVARVLASSVVYVWPDATLAEVRRKMDEASKSAPGSVRDALVTATGRADEPLLGYITDIDLAEKGALK
jgi:CBS domain-containing protein